MGLIVKNNNFGIADFIEEEQWLEEQHKNGYRLVSISGIKYYFENCNTSEWIYQLDFLGKKSAEEEYIQLFTDCGWEFVLQNNNWCYFRRKKEANVDLSIFSDRSSKIDMYTRILQSRHLIICVALFIMACAIEYFTIFTTFFRGQSSNFILDFLKGALPWIGGGLFVATSLSGYSIHQYIKLREKVKELI